MGENWLLPKWSFPSWELRPCNARKLAAVLNPIQPHSENEDDGPGPARAVCEDIEPVAEQEDTEGSKQARTSSKNRSAVAKQT